MNKYNKKMEQTMLVSWFLHGSAKTHATIRIAAHLGVIFPLGVAKTLL